LPVKVSNKKEKINRGRFLPYFIPVLILLASCRVSNKLQPGQYLIDKVEVKNVKATNVPKENFEAFFRQRPNRKLFRKFQFFVWWYTRFDPQKIEQRRVSRNLRYDRKNADKVRRIEKKNIRRAKKGKRPKVPRLKDKESPTLIESVRDIGEPPVILDSVALEQTRLQLSRYLFTKGYYINKVRDSVVINRRKKTAQISYMLEPGVSFHMNRIVYEIEDSGLSQLFLADTMNRLIHRGMQYDGEKLQQERQRLTDLARNNGYYNFENAYTSFDIDSSMTTSSVNVIVQVARSSKRFSSESDSLVYTDHIAYKINDVFVITEPVIGNLRDATFTDTLKGLGRGITFLLNGPLKFKAQMLLSNIDIYKGQLFRKDTAQQTYKQLSGLGIFKNVIIQFLPAPGYRERLDCYIVCSPLIRQSLSAETEGTHTYGNYGIAGGLNYQNRNSFRGGELAELRLQGSISAQTQFQVNKTEDATIGELPSTFNTIQFGPEFSFSVPRAFFPFSLLPFRKDMSPRTYIKSSVNYQARPEFNRVITSIDYGFNFKTHNNTLRHDIIPAEVYFVRANLTQAFRDTLRVLNDAFLVNSFQDHVTTLSRYTVTYFTKENTNTSRRTVHYVRWNIQSSGSILRNLFDATDQPKDSLNRYLIYGIPFAHFLRTDIDYRIYIPVRKRSRVVYRVAGGIGKPLVNLNVLPYEQSFFSGGPNSVRAWRARTLGPGGNPDTNLNSARYDKIGDILLEGNVEYRFHILKSFNGAFFADAGNIWRLTPDDTKPGGEFLLHKFADQIAIGGGVGIRWDLNFFVLRVDFAMPLKDPKYPEGQRLMTFERKPWRQTVINFGLGYPF
jgi:outer membrane protein assembly factor BamA